MFRYSSMNVMGGVQSEWVSAWGYSPYSWEMNRSVVGGAKGYGVGVWEFKPRGNYLPSLLPNNVGLAVRIKVSSLSPLAGFNLEARLL